MRKVLCKILVSHVSLWVRMVLYGSCKRNCGILTLFRLVSLSIASLEFFFRIFFAYFHFFLQLFSFRFRFDRTENIEPLYLRENFFYQNSYQKRTHGICPIVSILV
jgi:hypothetical protein